MSKKFTELRFEEWIEKSLLDNGYNHSFTHSNENEGRYDKDLCLVEEDVIGFIKDTQLEEYEKLQTQFDSSTDSHILKTIHKTIKIYLIISRNLPSLNKSLIDQELLL